MISAGIYLRGWRLLHRRDPERWHFGRLAAFLVGLATIYLALASPIEPFASLLLQVHMLQHLLLMMIAPPLIWLGWPLFPLLRGLPVPIRTYWVAPLLRWRPLRDAFACPYSPIRGVADLCWHDMAVAYAARIRVGAKSGQLARCRTCMFLGKLRYCFGIPSCVPIRVVQGGRSWLLFPYLLLADLQNTVLAAWLYFSPAVLYPHYLRVPRLAGISALDDQATAGVLMWVPGSIALLVAAVLDWRELFTQLAA